MELSEMLQGKSGNCVYPFFLLPDDVSPETARKDIRRLAAEGAKGVCVEPNFNRYFAGPRWWEQMDAVMEEARSLGMKVWLQDEPTFPTGSANDHAKYHPELQKLFLKEAHIDAVGPQKGRSFLIQKILDDLKRPLEEAQAKENGLPNADMGPHLLCVTACKKKGQNGQVDGNYVNLTSKVEKGILTWDIPEGQWRVFVVYTIRGGEGRPHYLNIFERDAVKLIIEKNYEPHYERYGQDFGDTFAGFFSDEPEFGNVDGYANDNSIGRKRMPLPWSQELEKMLAEQWRDERFTQIPALWYDSGECTSEIRYRYMDTLTQLYEVNFSKQLRDWCHAHHCEYIGHVVEDMGNHARLGCGAGHYFRAMKWQDYAGIDLVLQQIRPGMDTEDFTWQGGETGGEFFHYGLAKLGSSAAHIAPKKQGRSICEIFAAYGNSLEIRDQKWLFDHMIVRGINHFIPQWNLKAGLGGEQSRYDGDPLFKYNHVLTEYVNRMCGLFSGGIHIAPAAVLYHAEAEWSGNYMPFEKPVHVLLENQLDCDVIPPDVFAETDFYGTMLCGDGLKINQETYRVLVVPYCQCIPAPTARFLCKAAENHFPVIFVEKLPEKIIGMGDEEERDVLNTLLYQCQTVSLEGLAEQIRALGVGEITVSGPSNGLRYYHYQKADKELYLFFNERLGESIETTVKLPIHAPAYRYDAFSNTLQKLDVKAKDGECEFSLSLSAYESWVVVFDKNNQLEKAKVLPALPMLSHVMRLERTWKISLADRRTYPVFADAMEQNELEDITAVHMFPAFSGTIRYETSFWMEKENNGAALSLGEVYETAEVWVNGKPAGVKIAPPYVFDLSRLLQKGENILTVEVTNTMVHEDQDEISKRGTVSPSGLLGPVQIFY